MDLRKALEGKLTVEENAALKTAFDVIGDIAIIEIDDTVRKKERLIAETLRTIQPNIKVVAKKVGMHEGEFRLQKLSVIAGEDRLETEYKENGCRFRLNAEEVYFSPRLSTERKRIAGLIAKGEQVLVMFSGAGPYPIVLAKNSPAAHITGVEKNPDGHKWAQMNCQMNRCANVTLLEGDVRDIVPTLSTFDRVLMPLPRGGEAFLDIALAATRPGGMIHFYDFLNENEFSQAKEKVRLACRAAGRRFRSKTFRKCGSSGPRFYRVCLDFWAY